MKGGKNLATGVGSNQYQTSANRGAASLVGQIGSTRVERRSQIGPSRVKWQGERGLKHWPGHTKAKSRKKKKNTGGTQWSGRRGR